MTAIYKYESSFAPYIEDLLLLKRKQGFIYDTEAYHLKCFDMFCVEKNISEPLITKDLIEAWRTLRDTEDKVYLTRRISAVRQLCLYMISLGNDTTYIPQKFNHKRNFVSHVLNDEEISAFFEKLDAYAPKSNSTVFNRLSLEYKILFRVIFCCGLRISEARKLNLTEVDLEQGILTILSSKGRKNRIVYMVDDLTMLCKKYLKLRTKKYHVISDLLFPAREPLNILQIASINKKFSEIWKETSYSHESEHKPTVHSLRHSYVVKRMNLWMENDVSLKSHMPYLSKYLGHESVDDTFYYYHQIDSAFKIIREKDTASELIIPEVNADE